VQEEKVTIDVFLADPSQIGNHGTNMKLTPTDSMLKVEFDNVSIEIWRFGTSVNVYIEQAGQTVSACHMYVEDEQAFPWIKSVIPG
jgi:hypothetical protein